MKKDAMRRDVEDEVRRGRKGPCGTLRGRPRPVAPFLTARSRQITREREAAEHQQKEEQALSRMDGTALPESDAIFSREHQLRRAVASGAASSLVQEEETKRRECVRPRCADSLCPAPPDAVTLVVRRAEIMRERRREAVMKTKEEKMAELKSYWIVNFTPENGKEDGKEVRPLRPAHAAILPVASPLTAVHWLCWVQILPVTVDPLVRKHLRLKQLYPLELSRPGGEEGEGSHFMCPSCKADIGYQQCYALTQCRHVLCQQCYKMCVVPDKQCPICSAAAPPKTIIKLEKGGASACSRRVPRASCSPTAVPLPGSSFASHNSVQVSVYAPAKT